MLRAILSQTPVIGQRLVIFMTVMARWMETWYGADIDARSIPSVRCGTDLQRMEV